MIGERGAKLAVAEPGAVAVAPPRTGVHFVDRHRRVEVIARAAARRRVLEHQSDFRVVAEADDAASAYRAFKTHAPDIVVMDISMPGASGRNVSGMVTTNSGSR